MIFSSPKKKNCDSKIDFKTDLLRHKSKRRKYLRQTGTIFLFLLPTILGLTIFLYLPFFSAIRNSFYNINLLNPAKDAFIGLKNYQNLLKDPKFFLSMKNTIYYGLGKVIVQVPLGLLFALLVNQGFKGRSIVRSAIFAPLVTAGAVVAVIWNLMYHPSAGIINTLLHLVGIPGQPFLTSVSHAMPSLIIMGVWQDVGLTMLLFLAGLQAIPVQFFEAAAIDGANKFQSFFWITLPLLKRTILLCVITATISSFKIFTPIYVMTKGGPQNSTLVSVYYIFEQGFMFSRMGYASALALVFMVVVVVISLLLNKLLSTEFEY